MEQNVIHVYKPVGMTPLQLISQLKKTHPVYQDKKIGYAGRLDPMADGILLLLIGDENKKKAAYEALPKSYSFDVLFGVTTDTYDTLGIITGSDKGITQSTLKKSLPMLIESLRGKKSQEYPPYSSRTVQGRPLFYWAREGKLHEITIPAHTITIYHLDLESLSEKHPVLLQREIQINIHKVTGDFRQEACLDSWKNYFAQRKTPIPSGSFSISCSSGTYIRSLCDEMKGIALRITRTAVGDYTLATALKI